MKLLAILAAFAAGAAAHALMRSGADERRDETAQPVTTYELDHDEAAIDAEPDAPVERRACVEEASRAMDFMTLQGASRVTFRLENGEKLKLHIPGDSGKHLFKGDQGLLEYRGQTFLSFAKDNGEIVGALYYVPAEDTEA